MPKSGYWRVLVVAIRESRDVARPVEGGVEARGREGRVRVAVLQVVALDRVADAQTADASARARRQPPSARAADSRPRALRRALCQPSGASQSQSGTPRAGAARRRAQRRRRRQQGEAEDQGRGQVAQAGLEAPGHALGAGGGGRGDEPGERGRRRPTSRASDPQQPGSRPRARGRASEAEPSASARRSSGQTQPEAVVEAGQEPVRPDRAVGQVAEHAVRFAAAERLVGRRQRDRAEVRRPRAAGCRRGRGCADTSSRRRPAAARPDRGKRPPPRARAARSATSPSDQHRGRQQEVELGPGGQPGGEADDARAPRSEGPSRPPLASAQALRAIATAASRKKIADDVVPRLARLVGERRHARGRSRPSASDHGADPVGPPDAPAGEQAARRTSRD